MASGTNQTSWRRLRGGIVPSGGART
jgi:hypothetical protein